MTCPKIDELLKAVHCGEPAEPHCPECGDALDRERRFVALIEEGLRRVRPIAPIAPSIRTQLRPRFRARRSWSGPIAAAAALLVAIGVVVAFAVRPKKPAAPEVAQNRDTPTPGIDPKRTESDPTLPRNDVARTDETATHRKEDPDSVEDPPEHRPTKDPDRRTLPEDRVEIAVLIRSGSLSVQGSKLKAGAARLVAGEEFRSDESTRVEVPGAVIHFSPGARARFEKGEGVNLAVVEKEAFIDADAGAALELRLAVPVRSAAGAGRFIAMVRSDTVYVHEGMGRAGDELLPEGTEHRLASGKKPAPQTPTLRARCLPLLAKESPVWAETFTKSTPKIRIRGTVAQGTLRSAPASDTEGYRAVAGIMHEDARLYAAGEGTYIRFRYLLKKSTRVVFQTFDVNQRENFEIELANLAVGAWTTVTLRVLDLQPNPGGRREARIAAGDVFESLNWYVTDEAELRIDDVQILERR